MTTAYVAETQQTIHFPDIDWCDVTPIGLKVTNKRFSYEEWEALQPKLDIMHKGNQWAYGDYLVVGEARHGEKTAQAFDAHKKTGIKIKTLMEYRRVSEKVPYSIRMESLDWSHGQIVAGLDTEAERAAWLQAAAEHDWKPSELSKAIKDAARPSIDTDAAEDKNYLDPHYKNLLLDYIASQHAFLNRCTYEPFKVEIERTIRAARFQHKRTRGGDREAVREQVNQGACTAEEVGEEVYLSLEEIKSFFEQIVGCEIPTKDADPREAGTDYEWRPIGVNTEMAKGSRQYGAFRKDAPSGDAFSRVANTSFVES